LKAEQVIFPVLRAAAKRDWTSKLADRALKPWNPFAPARYADPYPLYEAARQAGRVSYQRSLRSWNVMGFTEAEDALRSPSTTVDRTSIIAALSPYTKVAPSTLGLFTSTLLMKDPPDHTRLRSLVNRAFTPRAVASLEPKIEKIAAELLHGIDGRSSCDVMTTFANALPIYVISEMLGLPRKDWDAFKQSSDVLVGFIDAITGFDPQTMDNAVESFRSLLGDLIEQREADPQDDMLSALLAAEENGDRLTRAELESLVVLLMVAGHETTASLIGNALVALNDRPASRDQLRHEPEIAANAVEELIRFDSPVQTTDRVVSADFELAGQRIREGQTIGIFLGAANRDPERFDRPNELILDREDPHSLSFGHGIHYCLGAALARLEVQVALPMFLQTFPDYKVNKQNLQWKRSVVVRGPEYLPVSL